MSVSTQHLQVAVDGDLELAVSTYDADGAFGTPVLLLHGLSQQRFFWGPVIDRLHARPVASIDQRGHGDSDTPLSADYSIDACAHDIEATLDVLGWPRAVVAGHSWGAWVGLRAAALIPHRVAALALVDGGLWTIGGESDRACVLRDLRPPELGVPADELWSMLRASALGASWSPRLQAALEPTFVVQEDGNVHTRIGVERHVRVLEGLLDATVGSDLAACEAAGVPIRAAVCEPRPSADSQPDPTRSAREQQLADAARRANLLIHRWTGAIHDVPLQWPSLVAGFIDSLVDDIDGAEHRAGAAAPVGGTA